MWSIIQLAPAAWLLDIKNDSAQTPIHLAVLTGQSNIARRLLIAGAKVSHEFLKLILYKNEETHMFAIMTQSLLNF